MTSLDSSIVHHLSGLNHNALTHATDKSQLKVGTVNAYLEFSFNPPISLLLVDSHCSKTPWSVFQDGSVKVVLTRSILSPRPHFLYSWGTELILSFSKPSAFFQATIASQDHNNKPRRSFAKRLPNFYSFLFNGFKSFNSFSKVLFIFPSRYLFAIGFPFIFSLGRSLSPYLSFNPKKLDSVTRFDESVLTPNTGISPSLLLSSMRLM